MEAQKKVFEVDSSSRSVRPLVDNDTERFEIRFQNADIITIVDQLNRLSDKFSVVVSTVSDSSSSSYSLDPADERPAPVVSADSVSGYFSGTYYEIIRDICLSAGYSFDRIEDHFYLGKTPVDLRLCLASTSLETSLKEEELSKLKAGFSNDLEYTLSGSKLLIFGRFYAVKAFRQYVINLNEVRRSYVARLVFVRLERSSISRIEAELKASKLDLVSSGYNLLDLFEAQLDCKLSNDNVYNYSEQLLYCSDGQKSTLKIGSSFQREQRAVSDYGTSTTTGYQKFEDGVDIELTPYRTLNGVVEVQLKFGNSKFQDTEKLSQNQVDLNYERLSLLENRLYYVASLNDQNISSGSKFLGLSSQKDGKILTCWLVLSPVVSVQDKRFDEVF